MTGSLGHAFSEGAVPAVRLPGEEGRSTTGQCQLGRSVSACAGGPKIPLKDARTAKSSSWKLETLYGLITVSQFLTGIPSNSCGAHRYISGAGCWYLPSEP